MKIDPAALSAALDAMFPQGTPALGIRAATPGDDDFLRALFIACSPYAEMLPAPVLAQQADLQSTAHHSDFPAASDRIVCLEGKPIGRVLIDWALPVVFCVDLAVLPDHQGKGFGSRLLGAWLEVLDQHDLMAGLMVLRSNRAARLYARLGFDPAPDDDADSPRATLRRAPRPVSN